MKIQIVSDLHLNVADMAPPVTDADLVVLAGDISRPQAAIAWARKFPQPVVYVPGNHEYYGGSLAGVAGQLRTAATGSNIHILDCDIARFGRVRILGCTLWSDFRLFSDPRQRLLSTTEAARLMYDFSKIRITDETPDLFTPAISVELFDRAASWLRAALQSPHDGATVVVTHHAPCTKSVHPKYSASPITPAFVSNLDELVASSGAALWIHGHVHDTHDYHMGNTRVVCNPRGYGKNGSNENPQFDPTLSVTITT
jgi:predicted phosphodiesterase